MEGGRGGGVYYGEAAVIVVLERGCDGGGAELVDVCWFEVDCIAFSYQYPILIAQLNAP